jgi:thiol-disulfide isomerase/thioredoxin
MKSLRTLAAFLAFLALPVLTRADIQKGDKPNLSFTAFGTRDKVDLSGLKGKIVVVDFWATWCHPCMNEASHMVSVNEKYAGKGFQFLGISLDQDPSALKNVIAEKKFTWPMSYEGKGWDGSTPKSWGVNSIPQTFIIGPDGTVLWRGHPAELDKPLEEAFRDHPPVLVDPKVAEQAKGILDKIEAHLAGNESAAALKLLASVPEAAKADPDIAARLTAATTKLQEFGTSELASVDPLIASGQYGQAIHKLRDLSSAFAGLPVAASAKSKLAQLGSDPKVQKEIAKEKNEKEAEDALASANQLKADGKDALAYPKFKSLVKAYAGTPAATEAATVVVSYEADKAFMTSYNNTAGKKKAESMLMMADNYRSSGSAEKAKAKYQDVIDQFPGTPWAETARKAIAAISTSTAAE